MIKPRAKVIPPNPNIGQIVEIKTLVSHPMETGRRKDSKGNLIPRNIIHTFVAKFAGEEIFRGDFNTGISANPYLAFFFKVPKSGDLELTWADDQGATATKKIAIKAS